MSPWLHLLLAATLVVVVGTVAVLAGAVVVQLVFRAVDRSQRGPSVPLGATGGSHVAPPPDRSTSMEAAGALLRGGRWIGYLERLAIYAALLAHYPEGIAIALAVKGLARYPELKSPSGSAAERFIIGTFTSVLFACACAGVAQWLLGLW